MHLDEVTHWPIASLAHSGIQIQGWALDPRAFSGSGIGAVHAWARRLDVPNSAAEFVGAATLSGHRPDVTTAFGKAVGNPGFRLAASLPRGLYEVTVYAWNWRTGRWEDARAVVVHVR